MGKAVEARGVGDLAKRSLETTGQIFRYGVAHGYCKRNPAADVRPGDVLKPTRKVNLARVDATQLPGLLKAIEVYCGKVVTRLATKLMALAFVRTSELIGARWPEFDIEARRWNIPAERMKMKTPHIISTLNSSNRSARIATHHHRRRRVGIPWGYRPQKANEQQYNSFRTAAYGVWRRDDRARL
jgi:integrase